jgi:hypothetical protein
MAQRASAALSFASELELIPAATRVGDPNRRADNVSAAGIGTNLFAAWEDERFGSNDPRIVAAFMSGAGTASPTVLRYVLAPDSAPQRGPQAAAGAGQYLVVYVNGVTGQQDISGVWVSNATGLAGSPFPIAATANNEDAPRVAAAPGTNPVVFAVVWQQVSQVGALSGLLLREGQTTPFSGPTTVADGPSAEVQPTLAYNGSNFILAWQDLRSGGNNVYLHSFSPTMLPASPGIGSVVLATALTRSNAQLIGGTGGQSLISFYEFPTLVWRALRLNGTSAIDPSPGLQPFVSSGAGGVGFLDDVNARYQLYSPAAASTDLLGRAVQMSDGGLVTYPPSATTLDFPFYTLSATRYLNGGNNYPFVAFTENRPSGGPSVRGVRVFSGGTTEPQLSQGEEAQEASSAATFGSGTEAVIAWSHSSTFPTDAGTGLDVGWRVFRADGGHSAPVLQALPGIAATPAAAAIGQRALVVQSDLGGRSGTTLTGSLFDATAPSTVQQVTIVTTTSGGDPPAAGALGNQFLVLWPSGSAAIAYTTFAPTATGTDGGFRTAPIGGAAAKVTSLAYAAAPGNGGLAVTLSGTGPYEARATRLFEDAGAGAGVQLATNAPGGSGPQIAADFDGTNFLVAWVDARPSATSPNVFGARVTPAGTVLDPSGVPLEVGFARARDVSLAFDGRHHVLAVSLDLPDGGTDIALHVLRPDLTVLYDAGVGTAAEPEKEPVLTPLGPGDTLIAFTRSKYDPNVLGNRVYATMLHVGLGDPCATNADCHSGFCAQGVCCSAACTGVCETCLHAQGAPADGTCGPRPASSVCRVVAGGGCDVAESCDGINPTCPADAFAPPTQVCRPASMGGCDIAERCTGTSATCPPDVLADAGTVCDSPLAPCAGSATCNGASDVCPAAGLKPAGSVCRAVMGPCDVEEQCDGLSQLCPADVFLSTAQMCRAAAGPCDVPEFCTGAMPACPTDLFKVDNSLCRGAAGVCDAEERCSGAGAMCPNDTVKPMGTQCRAAAGVCDVAESCDGTSIDCPTDAVAPKSTGCRAAVSSCDVAEVCDGVAASCPDDALARDGEMCAAASGAGTCKAGVCQAGSGKTPSEYSFGCSSSPGALSVLAVVVAGLTLLRRRRAVTLAAVVLIAGAAQAEEKRLKVVWFGVHATAGVSEQSAQSISDNVQTELSTLAVFQVVSQTDLAAALGVERQKQLLGCSDEASSCLMEIAGALNADRLVRGDVSRLDETIILNLSLVDLSNGRQIARVGRQVDGGLSKLLKETHDMVLELAGADPMLAGKTLEEVKYFGGLVIGVRGDADLMGPAVAPGIWAEWSSRWVGAAVTLLPKVTFGARVEGRFYPVVAGRLRPFIGVGTTVFTTGAGFRAGGGAAARLGPLQLGLDAAFEYFATFGGKQYQPVAVVLGLGLGFQL